MAIYKLPKELKNRMEKELRQYWDNIKKIERLEREIIEESNKVGQETNNISSDPTGQKAIKLLSTRSLILLNERILYVSRVIGRLKPFEREVFYLIFKENYDCLYCQTIRNINKNTYYNIYNKSIYYLAEEFGEI